MSGDKLCWDLEKDGIYSVRSAYKAIFSDEWSVGMEPYSKDSKLWKTIWHAEMLLRVKIFVWRACLKAIPTYCGLHIRIPSVSVQCICGLSRSVWKVSSLGSIVSEGCINVCEWWSFCLKQLEGEDVEKF